MNISVFECYVFVYVASIVKFIICVSLDDSTIYHYFIVRNSKPWPILGLRVEVFHKFPTVV